MERLTKWEGRNPDGSPRAVLAKHDGLFYDILQPALAKLARYEDMEEFMEQNIRDELNGYHDTIS